MKTAAFRQLNFRSKALLTMKSFWKLCEKITSVPFIRKRHRSKIFLFRLPVKNSCRMKTLFRLTLWDLKIQARNGILTVAVVIAAIYTGIFFLLGLRGNDKILVAIVFADPTFMGFIFTGVLVLFEKSSNTLQALVVTPVKIWQYFFAKAISLSLIALL